MITTARQLKDLIRNMSKKKSADAQILMRNYMMERFLERISLSEYKNQLCAQLRVCNQVGGNPIYPRSSQPDNSESWDVVGNSN